MLIYITSDMKILKNTSCALFFAISLLFNQHATAQQLKTLQLKDVKDLKEFFRYKGKSTPVISGHRGGTIKGFPENCIATFENTLKYTPAFF